MPRWLGAILLIAIGLGASYQAIFDPHVRMRGSKRELPVLQGRIFLGFIAVIGIVGGLLVYFGPF